MKNSLIILGLVLVSFAGRAQNNAETFINAQIGLGITAPYYSVDEIADNGLFLQGEYGIRLRSWVQFRSYIGFISTHSNGTDMYDNPTTEMATTKAILLGAKGRIRAPIPWVAPYLEAGIGASVGKFETFTTFTDIQKKGIAYHIPVSLGLELGRNHGVDLGISYYFMPTIEQFAGAAAVGISIPL